jgi:hypothetical protein
LKYRLKIGRFSQKPINSGLLKIGRSNLNFSKI